MTWTHQIMIMRTTGKVSKWVFKANAEVTRLSDCHPHSALGLSHIRPRCISTPPGSSFSLMTSLMYWLHLIVLMILKHWNSDKIFFSLHTTIIQIRNTSKKLRRCLYLCFCWHQTLFKMARYFCERSMNICFGVLFDWFVCLSHQKYRIHTFCIVF